MADDVFSGASDFQDISRSVVDRRIEPVRRVFRIISIALLVFVIVLPALQIFLREVAQSNFIGSAELARFMLICTCFVAFPYVVSSGANIRMEEIQLALPAPVVRWLRPLIAFLGVVAFALVSYSTTIATINNLQNATPALGIPYYVFFSATFMGCLMTAFECVVITAKAIARQPLYVKFEAERPPDELTEL